MKDLNFWFLYILFIIFASFAGFGFFSELNAVLNWGLNHRMVYRVGFVISVALYLITGRILSVAWWKLFLILVVSATFKRWVYADFPSLGFAIPYLLWEYTHRNTHFSPTQTR
jgi:hypothetical protein